MKKGHRAGIRKQSSENNEKGFMPEVAAIRSFGGSEDRVCGGSAGRTGSGVECQEGPDVGAD